MVDVYSTEAERRAALAEVTALRRQFDTTTAKGAAAFAKDPAAQAALARLDAAKSAAGMRTAAQDLQALNTVSGRRQTEQLNAPSKEYFGKVQEAYQDQTRVPTWKPTKSLTLDKINELRDYNIDASKARYDWVWFENPETGKSQWAMGLIGLVEPKPQKPANLTWDNAGDYANRLWYSDSNSLSEIRNSVINPLKTDWDGIAYYNKKTGNAINFKVLEEAIPEIKYSQLQEILYRLSLERDEDITIEDILDKYDEMFGEG